MRSTFVMFLSAAALILGSGCNTTGNIVDPGSTPPGISESKNGIQYTFSVSKDTLGILDTLSMTVTALNQADTSQTIFVSDYSYKWTLTDSLGRTIASGPTAFSNLVITETLAPNESRVIYRVSYSMADLFNAPIKTGHYHLKWNLSNGLSFQMDLLCEGQTAGPGVTSPIYPLKVGNEWTFLKLYLFHGNVLGTDTVTEQIVGQSEVKGETWFLLRSSDYVDEYITSRPDGIYRYFPGLDTAVLLYKYPATVGDSYTSGYELGGGSNDTFRIVPLPMTVDSTNEVLSVPYGAFTCYKYTQPEDSLGSPTGATIIPSQTAYFSSVGPVARGSVDGSISELLLSVNFK